MFIKVSKEAWKKYEQLILNMLGEVEYVEGHVLSADFMNAMTTLAYMRYPSIEALLRKNDCNYEATLVKNAIDLFREETEMEK